MNHWSHRCFCPCTCTTRFAQWVAKPRFVLFQFELEMWVLPANWRTEYGSTQQTLYWNLNQPCFPYKAFSFMQNNSNATDNWKNKHQKCAQNCHLQSFVCTIIRKYTVTITLLWVVTLRRPKKNSCCGSGWETLEKLKQNEIDSGFGITVKAPWIPNRR